MRILGLREIKILPPGPIGHRMGAPTQDCPIPKPACASPPSQALPGAGWGA